MRFVTRKDIKIPKRKVGSHKGDNGKVLIIGGSRDYIGAVALAGLAALRSGVDWVTIAAPEKVGWAINALSADLVVKKYKCDYFSLKYSNEIIKLSNGFDIVLIGNGVGINIETKKFIKKIIKKIKNLKVIDADGIKAISLKDVNNAILTPHKGELKILLKNSKIKEKDLQKNLRNNILLIKGPIDKIISKNKIIYNKTGNAGMTKGGTGDVLAGLCAGFLTQSRNLLQSAVNAAYINGLIGDLLLKKKKGFSYLASDMVWEIKRILR